MVLSRKSARRGRPKKGAAKALGCTQPGAVFKQHESLKGKRECLEWLTIKRTSETWNKGSIGCPHWENLRLVPALWMIVVRPHDVRA
jgi:hypothetical protein